MARRPSRPIVVWLALVSLMGFAGCGLDALREPPTTETHAVELDQTESLDVDLTMGAGEIEVRGGSAKLMDGEFTFSPSTLRPELQYDGDGPVGRLRIDGPSRRSFRAAEERWKVRLNDGKPTDLEIKLGAGHGRFELGTVNLRRLTIEVGAGEAELDLRGTPRADYEVSVRGGVGETRIRLPQHVGIVADIRNGLGEIRAPGLEQRDGRYVNAEYGSSKTTVRFDVRGGIGSIVLE